MKLVKAYKDGVEYLFDEWKYHFVPTANTIMYLPLKKDVNDYSGNNRHGTNNGVTLTTEGGVRCAINNGTQGNIILANVEYSYSGTTFNFWSKCKTFYNYSGLLNLNRSNSGNSRLRVQYGASNSVVSIGDSDKSNWSNVSADLMGWHLYTIERSGGSTYMYIDGILKSTQSTAYSGTFTPTVSYLGPCINATAGSSGKTLLSELIIENKTRTAQEISAYYNNTKSNYGL